MKVLWVTDIWGVHSSQNAEFEQLKSQVEQCERLDPYAGQPFVFDDEQQAYDYFQCRCSAPGYAELLRKWLEKHNEPVILLGFSAGANAIASTLTNHQFSQVVGTILIYGNRLPELQSPLTQPSHLLLCNQDSGVNEWQPQWPAQLQHSSLGHGFMNPRSPNFDQAGAASAWSWVAETIKALA